MIFKSHLLTCLCILLALWLPAQVEGIHLSWNNDQGSATSQTIAITWLSDDKTDAIIKYGVDSNRLNSGAKGRKKYSDNLRTYVYKATIRKLKPGTFYYYRVGNTKKVSGKIFGFQTSGGDDTTNRTIVGIWSDTQDNNGNRNFEQTDTIVKQLAKFPLDFTIHTGDIVNNGSVESSWKVFFKTAQSLNANFPLMSVTGNHDVVNDSGHNSFQKPFPVYYELFNLPNDQLNYSYIYGNAKFIAINSGYAKGAEKKDAIIFKPGSAEYRWLDQELSKAKSNIRIKWIIVYCHYPVYAFGISLVSRWQQHITPLLDKYGVDLCISGHRHVYERHKAIKGGTVYEMTDDHVYNQPAGTIYITNGSAGGSLQGTGGNHLPTMVFTPLKKIYTYAVMNVGSEDIRFDVYDKEGRRIDYFKIQKTFKAGGL